MMDTPMCGECGYDLAVLRTRDGRDLCHLCYMADFDDMEEPVAFYGEQAPDPDPDGVLSDQLAERRNEQWFEERGHVPSWDEQMEEDRERWMEWMTRPLTEEEQAAARERARRAQEELEKYGPLPF